MIANKGISANLLQAGSKRRRTKQQIADEKAIQEQEELRKAAKLAQYDLLEHKVREMEKNKSQGEAAVNLMSQFMEDGVVQQDEDGSFLIHDQSGVKRFRADEGQ